MPSKMFEKLYKFDLDHCDLPTMLWNVAVGLRTLILNVDSRYGKGIPSYYYVLTIGAGICYFYVFFISMVWFVSIRCPQTGDLVAAMVVLSLGIASEIGNLKLIYMLIYADRIRKLTDEFLECDKQTIPGSRFQSNLLKNLRVVKKRAIFYWVVINGNGVLYLLIPIFTPGRNLPENYVIYGTLDNMWEQLSKFSLDYCDLPTMLWNVSVGLRVLTINIDSKYHKGIPIYYYLLMLVFAASYLYSYLISMVWFVIERPTEDLVATLIVISLGLSGEVGIVKLYMVINIDKNKKMVDDFLECDAQTVLGGRFQANLLKSLRIVKKRALAYWFVLIGNVSIYILRPLAFPGRNLPENRIILYGLEPTFESPNYELTYFFTSAGAVFACYIPACVTAYLVVIVGYIESQMLALGEEMLQIWPDAVEKANIDKASTVVINSNMYEAYDKMVINEIVEERLKQAIAHHALLINLFYKVESTIRDATAMGFVFLVMGLITVLLGKLENTYLQMPYILIQVAMDCFTGQKVMDASIVFEEALYACQWEKFDTRNRKLVLVMLQVAQNPMILKAGGISALNFAFMMSILKGTYSAYTTLRLRFNL